LVKTKRPRDSVEQRHEQRRRDAKGTNGFLFLDGGLPLSKKEPKDIQGGEGKEGGKGKGRGMLCWETHSYQE